MPLPLKSSRISEQNKTKEYVFQNHVNNQESTYYVMSSDVSRCLVAVIILFPVFSHFLFSSLVRR